MHKKLSFKRKYLALPYGVFMGIFIVLPLILILFYAFTEVGQYGQMTWRFTFSNFTTIFSSTYMSVIWESVKAGILTTIICFLVGYPTAYLLSNKKFNKSSTLVLLFILPMWINFLLRTLATKAFFDFIGIGLGMFTNIFGMVYNFLPFMILPIYTNLTKLDNSLLEAANDLGAKPLQSFLKVIFPLSLPGVLSGVTMVFTPVITTYVISDMLSNNKISFIGNLINIEVGMLNYNTASAISFLLLIFIALSMFIVNRVDKSSAKAGGELW